MNAHTDQNDVSTALGLLRASISEEEQRIRNEDAKAVQEGGYDTATSVIELANGLLAFASSPRLETV